MPKNRHRPDMSLPDTIITDWLTAHGHPYDLVRHPATATAAEGRAVRADLAGAHSKSLLVANKAGALVLIMLRSAGRADLKGIGRALGLAGRLSFADEARMRAAVGVGPGHLSPLALILDPQRTVTNVVFDSGLTGSAGPIWCHPLHNEASVALSAATLTAFVTAFGPTPTILDAVDAAP